MDFDGSLEFQFSKGQHLYGFVYPTSDNLYFVKSIYAKASNNSPLLLLSPKCRCPPVDLPVVDVLPNKSSLLTSIPSLILNG